MAELRKFKEVKPLDTPTQNSKENPDKIKNGNETGVGTDFTQNYNEVLNRVQKEKFPNYIDPSTIDVVNNPDSMEKFQEMSQMKESLLRVVDEELKNPKALELEPETESKTESILEFFDKKTNVGTITPEELKQAEADARDPKFWEKVPEKKLTKKEINKLPEEEKKKIIDSMTTDELWEADYRFGDAELENAINKKVGLDPNKIRTSEKKTPVINKKEEKALIPEKQNNVPEKTIFTQEDQLLSEKLEKEIDELEREISELENLRVAKLEELAEEKKVEEGSPSAEEGIPESKETVTENLTKEQYKNALDSIIINKYAKIFEKNNNLQYENTFVTNTKDGVVQKGTIYTEIKFSKGRNSKKFMFLKFELKSQNRVAHLMNERWEVGVFDKLSGFNKENAKKISGAIIQDFIANQKKGNEFKINIEDGDLIMTHQI